MEPPEAVLASLGVPTFAPDTLYNYVALDVWTNSQGTKYGAEIWSNPLTHLGSNTGLGNRNSNIQSNMHDLFANADKKILLSVFGEEEFPTSSSLNAGTLARKLARFVTNNNFDGVSIDYNDLEAINSGEAWAWL